MDCRGTTVAPRAPLASIEYGLLRAAPRLRALDHVVELLVALLAHVESARVLPQVAARGSPQLFLCIARSMDANPKTDRAVLAHWLARAMERALRRDDLAMAQAIHTLHTEPLDVQSLRVAIQHGTLETVAWLVVHRADRICSEPGVENLCASCVLPVAAERDAFRIVRWLIEEGVIKLRGDDSDETNGHTLASTRIFEAARSDARLTRWLQENGLLRRDDATRLLRTCLTYGPPESADTVAVLIEAGYFLPLDQLVDALVAASVDPKMENVLAVVMGSPLCEPLRDKIVFAPFGEGPRHVLQWDVRFLEQHPIAMARLEATAGAWGHLELLQWLWHTRNVMPVYTGFHVDEDEDNEIRVLEWIHTTLGTAPTATAPGHWESPCLLHALARRGHLRALQWFKRHKWLGDSHWPPLIDAAATYGHMPIVEWAHAADGSCAATAVAMDRAAEHGHLELVAWLHERRQDGCTHRAMDRAAANGHLHVLRFLHANRSEGCSAKALQGAIKHGHLEVVQWLVTNGLCEYGLRELLLAVVRGHVEVLAWLFERRQDVACTPATLLCESTRDPLHYIDPFRFSQVAARDTLRWLCDRYSRDQQCHGSYGHFSYEGQLLITETAAQVGDLPLVKSVLTTPMPPLPSTEEDLVPMAVKTGHVAFARWAESWLEELNSRYT